MMMIMMSVQFGKPYLLLGLAYKWRVLEIRAKVRMNNVNTYLFFFIFSEQLTFAAMNFCYFRCWLKKIFQASISFFFSSRETITKRSNPSTIIYLHTNSFKAGKKRARPTHMNMNILLSLWIYRSWSFFIL